MCFDDLDAQIRVPPPSLSHPPICTTLPVSFVQLTLLPFASFPHLVALAYLSLGHVGSLIPTIASKGRPTPVVSIDLSTQRPRLVYHHEPQVLFLHSIEVPPRHRPGLPAQ